MSTERPPAPAPVPASAPARARTGRRSTLVAAVAGAVCAIASAYLLLVTVPGARAEERQFRAAASCRADAVAKKCLRPETATVAGTETVTSGRSAQWWLSVTQDDGTGHRIRMTGRPRVFHEVKPGDRVTVTYWHHKSRYVDFRNIRETTHDDPRNGYRLPYALALALLPAAAGFLWAAYWCGRRSTAPARPSPRQLAPPSAAALFACLTAAASPWYAHGVWEPLLITGLATVPLPVCAALAVLRRRKRPDGPTAPAPSGG
ncbi:hypothetical protein ACH4UT_28415 [Streptomyces sp. NPDC020799]|uniref:hypothetical protein n=1 Tax=unclassified Streptomyces TaxID=2593676 RepID=UPI0033ED8044